MDRDSITHELVIGISRNKVEKTLLDDYASICTLIISGLRISSDSDIAPIACLNTPWDSIKQAGEDCWYYEMSSSRIQKSRLPNKNKITRKSLNWVSKNINSIFKVTDAHENYSFAIHCFETYHHTTSLRHSIATLWSGIESLFSVRNETTFRLSLQIACLLEAPGEQREELYKRIKKLYDQRSKVIHGSTEISDTKMLNHIIEVKRLLGRILRKITEQGRLPTEADILLLCNVR